MDLSTALPRLLPKAIAWAETEADKARGAGSPLDEAGIRLARAVGVRQPERVRVVEAEELPAPADAELGAAASLAGLLGPGTAGLKRP